MESCIDMELNCPNCGKQTFSVFPFWNIIQCRKCWCMFELEEKK